MDSTVGAYEGMTHLAVLLDRVEKGETLTITRNGRPVARLVPTDPPARCPKPKRRPWWGGSANSGKS